MARLIHKGWRLPRFPEGRFTINWDSPQAAGLVFWLPLLDLRGASLFVDKMEGKVLTASATPPSWTRDSIWGEALRFYHAESRNLSFDASPLQAPPLTLMAWVYPQNAALLQAVVGLGNTVDEYRLNLAGQVAGDPVQATTRAGGSAASASTTAGFNLNGWQHVAARFLRNNHRTAFLNAGNQDSNTTSKAPGSLTRLRVGRAIRDGTNDYLSSLVMDVRVYNIGLDIQQLEQIVHPNYKFDLYRPIIPRFWSIPPSTSDQTITPASIASAEAFGSPTFAFGGVTISPASIASAEAFGTPTIVVGNVTISPASIASEETFGVPTIVVGDVTITPASITSEETFGVPTIVPGAVTISVAGITSAEAFGTPSIVMGGNTITPASIVSAEVIGTVTILVGGVSVSPAGIASEEAFGSPTIIADQIVSVSGIASAEAFGVPTISTAQTITVVSIVSAEAFGVPTVTTNQVVSLTGIASAQAFGVPSFAVGAITELVVGIPSSEAFGTPLVSITSVVAVPAFIQRMQRRWELWICDAYGSRLAPIVEHMGFEYASVTNNVGSFRVVLPSKFDRDLLRVDNIVELWRAPDGHGLKMIGTGFMRRFIFEDGDNDERIVISGPDSMELLKRKIVAYAAGSAQSQKTAPADDMMKAIVRENMGSLAGARNLSVGRLFFDVEADKGMAPSITKGFSWRQVLAVLQDIAAASDELGTPLFFGIRPYFSDSSSIVYSFFTKTNFLGVDRTSSGGFPANFGHAWGNVSDVSLEFSYLDEVNHVYGAGQGNESDRLIVEAADSVRVAASPYNRREALADARNESSSAGVTNKAKTELANGRPRMRFSAKLHESAETPYGIRWSMGDRLQVQHSGYEFEGMLKAVKFNVTNQDQETIDARLEVEV